MKVLIHWCGGFRLAPLGMGRGVKQAEKRGTQQKKGEDTKGGEDMNSNE